MVKIGDPLRVYGQQIYPVKAICPWGITFEMPPLSNGKPLIMGRSFADLEALNPDVEFIKPTREQLVLTTKPEVPEVVQVTNSCVHTDDGSICAVCLGLETAQDAAEASNASSTIIEPSGGENAANSPVDTPLQSEVLNTAIETIFGVLSDDPRLADILNPGDDHGNFFLGSICSSCGGNSLHCSCTAEDRRNADEYGKHVEYDIMARIYKEHNAEDAVSLESDICPQCGEEIEDCACNESLSVIVPRDDSGPMLEIMLNEEDEDRPAVPAEPYVPVVEQPVTPAPLAEDGEELSPEELQSLKAIRLVGIVAGANYIASYNALVRRGFAKPRGLTSGYEITDAGTAYLNELDHASVPLNPDEEIAQLRRDLKITTQQRDQFLHELNIAKLAKDSPVRIPPAEEIESVPVDLTAIGRLYREFIINPEANLPAALMDLLVELRTQFMRMTFDQTAVKQRDELYEILKHNFKEAAHLTDELLITKADLKAVNTAIAKDFERIFDHALNVPPKMAPDLMGRAVMEERAGRKRTAAAYDQVAEERRTLRNAIGQIHTNLELISKGLGVDPAESISGFLKFEIDRCDEVLEATK